MKAAESIALKAWRCLNGRDAGRIDLRSDASGNPQFLEANPLAGLHPQHSDLPMLATAVGMSYVELIRRIVDSAISRVAPSTSASSRFAFLNPGREQTCLVSNSCKIQAEQ